MFGRTTTLHHHIQRSVNKRAPSTKLKAFVDKLIWPASLFGIVITLPQVWEIWYLHQTAGVSIISWSGYIITSLIWLFYGLVHKLKPIIATNIIWFFMNSAIVLGVLLYQ